MSWSMSFIGKPDALADAVDKFSEKCTGESRVEFDLAKAHLVALIRQNFAQAGQQPPTIKLTASGSGYCRTSGGRTERLSRSCCVDLEANYATLV